MLVQRSHDWAKLDWSDELGCFVWLNWGQGIFKKTLHWAPIIYKYLMFKEIGFFGLLFSWCLRDVSLALGDRPQDEG